MVLEISISVIPHEGSGLKRTEKFMPALYDVSWTRSKTFHVRKICNKKVKRRTKIGITTEQYDLPVDLHSRSVSSEVIS